MKRFYTAVAVKADGAASFAITLDGRPVKTPGGATLSLRTEALADAVAAEWAGQGETIDERTMPLTRLANTAIDRVHSDRAQMVRQLALFAGHDLVCYRAAEPPALVARETAAWDEPLEWARIAHGLDLKVTHGLQSVTQSGLDGLAATLDTCDEFVLTGLVTAAGILKSVVLALSLADGRLDAVSAHRAAHVDEIFQIEKWGRDAEAEDRLAALQAELETAARFIRLALAAQA